MEKKLSQMILDKTLHGKKVVLLSESPGWELSDLYLYAA